MHIIYQTSLHFSCLTWCCQPMFSFSLKSTENEYTGVNFINVKRTKNSYERRISAAFSSYMYVEKRHLYEIFVRITLMKLTTDRRCPYFLQKNVLLFKKGVILNGRLN